MHAPGKCHLGFSIRPGELVGNGGRVMDFRGYAGESPAGQGEASWVHMRWPGVDSRTYCRVERVNVDHWHGVPNMLAVLDHMNVDETRK